MFVFTCFSIIDADRVQTQVQTSAVFLRTDGTAMNAQIPLCDMNLTFKRCSAYPPRNKEKSAGIAVVKQIVDDRCWPTDTHTAFPNLHRQIYNFMMSFLLSVFVCCGYLCGLNRINVKYTLVLLGLLNKVTTWDLLVFIIFFSSTFWCVHPCTDEVSVWDNGASLSWLMRWIQPGQRVGMNVFVRQARSPLLCSPLPWENSVTA